TTDTLFSLIRRGAHSLSFVVLACRDLKVAATDLLDLVAEAFRLRVFDSLDLVAAAFRLRVFDSLDLVAEAFRLRVFDSLDLVAAAFRLRLFDSAVEIGPPPRGEVLIPPVKSSSQPTLPPAEDGTGDWIVDTIHGYDDFLRLRQEWN